MSDARGDMILIVLGGNISLLDIPKLLWFAGEKPEMQGAVRLESGTVKTMSSWMTSTSQGVHPAHKEAGMTLSAPARTNNVQHQLHGRMCDITPSCQVQDVTEFFKRLCFLLEISIKTLCFIVVLEVL